MTTSEPCVIRKYTAQDRNGLDACVRELQDHERAIEPRMKPTEDIIGTYVDTMLEQCAACEGAILVAEAGGAIVGYVCVHAAAPNEDPDEIDYTFAYVSDVAVNSSQRGRGIGKTLLEAAREYAQDHGAACLRISVLAENAGALSLYRSFGFAPRVIELEMSIGDQVTLP